VALVQAASPTESRVVASAAESAGRSTRAFRLIEAVLRESGWEREEIDRIAVGLGPGSYHGIRSAIALAQGWSLGRPLELVGVSSAACLGRQRAQQGAVSEFAVVIDAQRGEFYLAGYLMTAAGWREVEPLRLVSAEDVETRLRAGSVVCGPEARRWFPLAEDLFPDAAILGCLAAGGSEPVAGERLEPIYLRATRFVKAPPPRFGFPRTGG